MLAISRAPETYLDRGGNDGFRLEPLYQRVGNDVHELAGCSLFRLHGPDRTMGWITACDTTNWHRIRGLLQNTTSRVRVNTSFSFQFRARRKVVWTYSDWE